MGRVEQYSAEEKAVLFRPGNESLDGGILIRGREVRACLGQHPLNVELGVVFVANHLMPFVQDVFIAEKPGVITPRESPPEEQRIFRLSFSVRIPSILQLCTSAAVTSNILKMPWYTPQRWDSSVVFLQRVKPKVFSHLRVLWELVSVAVPLQDVGGGDGPATAGESVVGRRHHQGAVRAGARRRVEGRRV